SSAHSLENKEQVHTAEDDQAETKQNHFIDQDRRRNTISSSRERLDLMQESILLWRNYPIFGVGDRNVQKAANLHMQNSLLVLGKVPHNGYIFVLLSGGISGTIILFTWLIWIFYKWLQAIRNKAFDLRLWFHAIPVIICGISALFLQDIFLIMSPTALIFWLNLGICANLSCYMTPER
ncbi:MAG TPA: O-antigen ligase family protein, partial [Clostridiaceae bacterium]|nr:O-antigen ligase family protein [Clostridiaceae bacterium]